MKATGPSGMIMDLLYSHFGKTRKSKSPILAPTQLNGNLKNKPSSFSAVSTGIFGTPKNGGLSSKDYGKNLFMEKNFGRKLK